MKRIAITAGEWSVDKAPALIETFLGSCVGIALYDRANRIGGLLHVILPSGMPAKEQQNPAAYVSSGVPFLLRAMAAAGVDCGRLVAALAGGAQIRGKDNNPGLEIGRRNIKAAREMLLDLAIPVTFEDLGEDYGRHMSFFLEDGHVEVRASRRRGEAVSTSAPATVSTAIPPAVLDETIRNLRPMSQTAIEALDLARDPTSSFQQLERRILRDQVLAATVLKLVNSAYYGLPRRVGTISQALALLGLDAFRKLVMQVVAHHVFARKLFAYSMEEGALLDHSLACAQLAELLARSTGIVKEEAYLAGLLHDLGKVVLERCGGAGFEHVLDLVNGQGKEFHQAERETLGIDHSAAGGQIAANWRLPENLAEAISCHHNPITAGRAKELVCVVHVADALCNALGVGPAANTATNSLDYRALQKLQLEEADLDGILAAMPRVLSGHA